MLLVPLSSRALSKAAGAFLETRASKALIPFFVKSNHIDLSEYDTSHMNCFNDCFSRKILPGRRPIDMQEDHLIAPCDGLLSVWPVNGDTVLPVKQSHYTISSLLKDNKLADEYKDGVCLVYRLCVNHYHRYCYALSGPKSGNRFIKGVLHTVRPVALQARPVFVENCREYTIIDSADFGKAIQMEVGAMLVGKIHNYHEKAVVKRGEEKGMFLYGGSTIIMLLKKGQVHILPEILAASARGEETDVRMGQMVGKK